jgi:hypothetical protein
MDNVSDKARAVAHCVPMAAAVARGPQHQIDVGPHNNIVGVPYCGVIFDVACDIEPADEEHPYPLEAIWAVKLNEVWFNAWPLRDTELMHALLSRLRAMPSNDDADEDRITAAMLEDRR